MIRRYPEREQSCNKNQSCASAERPRPLTSAGPSPFCIPSCALACRGRYDFTRLRSNLGMPPQAGFMQSNTMTEMAEFRNYHHPPTAVYSVVDVALLIHQGLVVLSRLAAYFKLSSSIFLFLLLSTPQHLTEDLFHLAHLPTTFYSPTHPSCLSSNQHQSPRRSLGATASSPPPPACAPLLSSSAPCPSAMPGPASWAR